MTRTSCYIFRVMPWLVGAGAAVKRANATLLFFECNQPNHLARGCLLRRKGRGESYGGRRNFFFYACSG